MWNFEVEKELGIKRPSIENSTNGVNPLGNMLFRVSEVVVTVE